MKEISPASNRLSSLDFLRGITMVLLTLESTRLFEHLEPVVEGTYAARILQQFTHHRWHGLHLWDLVQPVFMFVAGVSLAFSIHKQKQVMNWNQSFVKTLKRCGWLFFWGVLDYAVRKDHLSFELWDVLTQLSFTTLIAFLILDWSVPAQLFVSMLCLLIPEFLYRFTQITGFDQPFVDQHNFGNFMDLVLMNKINNGGWVAINCISTSAHTIWGVLAGKLLLSDKTRPKKVQYLLAGSAILFVLGFGLDIAGITPIIKKIATSSFVLASGGWCVLFLTICYWWIDIRDHKRKLQFFNLFALNSLFIYLFFEIVGYRWFTDYVLTITHGLFLIAHIQSLLVAVIGSLVVFALEASLLYFLYVKRIFFRI